MRDPLTTICNKTIEYSFYALLFLVPIVITSRTSELFEFNKMWVTFGLTIIILVAWVGKMVIEKRFFLQRTPLDIPLALFLLSQTISTLFSLDTHTSLWGYYSRFNGGYFSLLSYILLFYAFISNLGKQHVVKSLYVSLVSGTIVALWGLPSHFGYDPTCLIFRNSLDVSCWTESFQPKIRIFSTLGQPNWLAIYLAIILPIAIGLGLITVSGHKKQDTRNNILLAICYLLLVTIVYLDILYTGSRSGFVGLTTGMATAALMFSFVFRKHVQKPLLFFLAGIFSLFIMFSFLQGTPFTKPLSDYVGTNKTQPAKPVVQGPALETGGTESGTIRLIVWQGALDAWKHYPIFGSGVETFAFAYYQFRPTAHNLTSEWDYLYNKAHNEYLNYLTTTGIFGLGSYLLIIGMFFYTFFSVISSQLSVLSQLLTRFQFISHKQTNRETEKQKTENGQLKTDNRILSLALLASYIAILVSNFFGFSVVIVNIYFFLIPAFVLLLLDAINPKYIFAFPKIHQQRMDKQKINGLQWIGIGTTMLVGLYLLTTLVSYWYADTKYAYGNNLDHVGQYQYATEYLTDAVNIRSDEPTFQDELSFNSAALSLAFFQENDATNAAQLAQQAFLLSNNIVQNHPNNITYWKTRTRIFTALAQIEPQYISVALDAIQHAAKLAPTDAKVQYNLALLQAENGDSKKAIATLEKTVTLKPDYADAYFKLGDLYHQQAVNKNGVIIKPDMQQKAVDSLRYILENIASQDAQTIKTLKQWGEKVK